MPSWYADDGTYHDDLSTRLWRGTISYAEFSNTDWFSIGGPGHPLFATLIDRIDREVPEAKEFTIYVNGGLLETWMSWDVDMALISRDPDWSVLKRAMRGILKIAFELHLYVDLKWQAEFWRPEEMTPDFLNEYQCWSYELANNFTRGEVVKTPPELEPHNGLWRRWNTYPFPKHLKRLEEGYTHRAPLVIWYGPEKAQI